MVQAMKGNLNKRNVISIHSFFKVLIIKVIEVYLVILLFLRLCLVRGVDSR